MKRVALVLVFSAFAAGCSKKAAEPPAPPAGGQGAEVSAPMPQPGPGAAPATELQPASAAPAVVTPQQATESSPRVWKAKFTTTKGDFVVEVHRDWAPNGSDRFFNLIKGGFFDDTAFFRAVEGFMVQFGLNGSPAVNARWSLARIPDDPSVGQSNKRGFITFATSGVDSRTTQVFINYGDNTSLDGMGFTPFGKVVEGMGVVDKLYKGYGDAPPAGRGPDQGLIQTEGNAYLKRDFPLMDYVKTARLAQ